MKSCMYINNESEMVFVMKCNNCGMELEEGVTLCPECGFENGEQNPEPQVTQESAEVDVPVTEPAEEPEPETPAEEPGEITE